MAKRTEEKKIAAAVASAAASQHAPPVLMAAASVPAAGHSSFSPFRLRNLTANSLCASVTFDGNAAGAASSSSSSSSSTGSAIASESSFTIVSPGEEHPLLLPSSGGIGGTVGAGAAQSTFVSLELGPFILLATAHGNAPPGRQAIASASFRPLRNVPVAQIGTLVYELQLASPPSQGKGKDSSAAAAASSSPSTTTTGSGVSLQIKISMVGGSKLLYLSSLHSVHNGTADAALFAQRAPIIRSLLWCVAHVGSMLACPWG